MATRLPIAIDFDVPASWVSAPPDRLGVPAAAYMLVHPPSQTETFVANLAIGGGVWATTVALTEIAEKTVQALRADPDVGPVELLQRRTTEPHLPPGLEQIVRAWKPDQGSGPYPVIQLNYFQTAPYPPDAAKRAIINFTLNATPEQWDTVVGDCMYVIYTVLQRTLGVQVVDQLENVDPEPVVQTLSEAADAVRDILATADAWRHTGWDAVADQP